MLTDVLSLLTVYYICCTPHMVNKMDHTSVSLLIHSEEVSIHYIKMPPTPDITDIFNKNTVTRGVTIGSADRAHIQGGLNGK